MSKCSKCNGEVVKEGVIFCSDCRNAFHPTCTRISTLEKFKKMSNAAKNSWKCDVCKTETSSRSDAESTDGRILEAIEGLRRDMSLRFTEVTSSISAINDRLGKMDSSIESIKVNLKGLQEENLGMKKDIAGIAAESMNLKMEVESLKVQLADSQQYSRRNNLEVIGVPYTNNEDSYSVLAGIAKLIEVPFHGSEISIAHRLPRNQKKNHPTMVVQFVRRTTKNEWVAAARKHRKKLTAAALHDSFPSTPIFINDHLTVANKMLLGRARQLVRERRLAHAWSTDCRVLVRRTPDGPVTQVKSSDDLERVLLPMDSDSTVG